MLTFKPLHLNLTQRMHYQFVVYMICDLFTCFNATLLWQSLRVLTHDHTKRKSGAFPLDYVTNLGLNHTVTNTT